MGASKLKVSELVDSREVHERSMRDPEYRAEWDAHALANAVALLVAHHRAEHDLTQKAMGERLGIRQPHVARLETGDHAPSIETLARVANALDVELRLDFAPAGREVQVGRGQAELVRFTVGDGTVVLSKRRDAPDLIAAITLALSDASEAAGAVVVRGGAGGVGVIEPAVDSTRR
jgi:transcriptional regulator with XRE-family HTH domain